ncbi:MAG: carboxylate--amine ligase [Syntrophobacterales bacterium GWC2_56_13]|nr:MAG: carboxylate--amine ligase [Syntrophobacterales bacterium GWC2_56_13]OHE19517.1 MAG: carboxylate--amine ligase [Syntrophobacterales bacterium GWF2_56_9]
MTETDGNSALGQGSKTLSEFESARLLAGFGIPTAKGILAQNLEEVKKAAESIGYPVVLKACSPEVSHKTESGLVAVDLRNEADLELAFQKISGSSAAKGGGFLVQEMIKGGRELVMGMIRDPQFGPCVMFGLGGIFTEILGDVTFRPAPLSEADAAEMMREIKGNKILDAVRGMPAVDADSLIQCLMAVGRIGMEREEIEAIDVNPLIIQGSKPVAVDALVILK